MIRVICAICPPITVICGVPPHPRAHLTSRRPPSAPLLLPLPLPPPPTPPLRCRAWAWTKGRRLCLRQRRGQKSERRKDPKKSLRYHRGATTPFRRRGHPAATAASRNCAASRGAARPPDVAALSGFRRFCDRRHGLDRNRPARDAAPRRVRVRANDVTTRERDDEEATSSGGQSQDML